MWQLFADAMTFENLSWAAVFAAVGAFLYAAWNKWARDWVVKKVDVLEDKIADKIKPYLGDDTAKVRKAMDEVEGVLLGVVDLLLARKFAGVVVGKEKVDKEVVVAVLAKAKASEEASKDVLGQQLYAELDVALKAMPSYIAAEDAINLLSKIEAHEKGEGEADVLKAVEDAKKVVDKK